MRTTHPVQSLVKRTLRPEVIGVRQMCTRQSGPHLLASAFGAAGCPRGGLSLPIWVANCWEGLATLPQPLRYPRSNNKWSSDEAGLNWDRTVVQGLRCHSLRKEKTRTAAPIPFASIDQQRATYPPQALSHWLRNKGGFSLY